MAGNLDAVDTAFGVSQVLPGSSSSNGVTAEKRSTKRSTTAFAQDIRRSLSKRLSVSPFLGLL